jgi:hypothetical protein
LTSSAPQTLTKNGLLETQVDADWLATRRLSFTATWTNSRDWGAAGEDGGRERPPKGKLRSASEEANDAAPSNFETEAADGA